MPENQKTRGAAALDAASAQAICKQAQTQAGFGLQLYKHAVKNLERFDKNALISPASIATGLSMTAAGAQGATLDQFVAFLKHKDAQDMHKFNLYVHNVIFSNNSPAGGPALGAANGLWIDERTPFNEQFAKNVKAAYGAEALEADFRLKAGELCKDINDWVRIKTGGKVTNILSTEVLYSYTRLMVVNALSFKGLWKEKFNSELTAPRTFHLLDGGTVAVPMMSSTHKHFVKSYSNWGAQSNYSSFSSNLKVDPWSFDQPDSNSSSGTISTGETASKTDSPVSSVGQPFEFKVLKLPYKTARGKDTRAFSMYVFLPEKRDGLPELERDLDAGWLMRELPQLTRAEPVGEFYLPKFKASFSFQANGALQSLGLTLPFSERKADFSTMLVDDEDSKDPRRIPTGCFCYGLGKKSRPLALSSMVHESVVEVSEEGGTGSGVISTKVAGLTRYNSIDPLYHYNFVADHPFLYVIREDTTGLIVFIGRVTNPKQDDVPLLDL